MRSIKLAIVVYLFLSCKMTTGNPQPTISSPSQGGMVYVIVMRTMSRRSPAVFLVTPDGEQRVGCIWSAPFIGTWACRTMLAREGFAFVVDNHGQGEVGSEAVEVHELHFAGHERRLLSDGSTFQVR